MSAAAAQQVCTTDSVYSFYRDEIVPALTASIPVLIRRIRRDAQDWFTSLPFPWPQTADDATCYHHVFFFPWNQLWFWQGLFVCIVLSMIPGRTHEIVAKACRWPILMVTYAAIGTELVLYVAVRLVIRTAEFVVQKHRTLRHQMAAAVSYKEWYMLAQELDRSQQRHVWLLSQNSNHKNHVQHHDDDHDHDHDDDYNWRMVVQLLRDLRRARRHADVYACLAVLQQCTRKNVGGIMAPAMFSYSNTGEPKLLVTEFVTAVAEALQWVTTQATVTSTAAADGDDDDDDRDLYNQRLQQQVRHEKDKLLKGLVLGNNNNNNNNNNEQQQEKGSDETRESLSQQRDPAVHRAELLAFLKRARAAYGRTALCLSGGAMMGLYHLGHLLGLMETGTLPHIVSGTSAGSAIAAILCTRTEDELKRDLRPEVLIEKLICFKRPWWQRIKSIWKTGHCFDFEEWHDLIQWFTCGDLTFAEAYKKSGRVFCITLSSTTKKASPVLLNHLTTPNVTLASAVVASAAVPGLVPPVRLQCKGADGVVRLLGKCDETYFDGSIRSDIPVSGLGETLNCQFFVVCQANPHIVPFFFGNKGTVGRPSRWSSGVQESSWRGGFLLTALEMYLKNDMKSKAVFLNELEAGLGFTSTMMTQGFEGTTTIVPQVSLVDYFRLFRDPKLHELYRYFQKGAVAAFEHVAMIKLHYSIADVLDECVAKLETPGTRAVVRRSRKAISLPGCRGPIKKKKKKSDDDDDYEDDGTDSPPPSILNLVLDCNKSQEEESGTTPATKGSFDEYSHEWIDLDN